jgi:hypothetical protein
MVTITNEIDVFWRVSSTYGFSHSLLAQSNPETLWCF